MFRVDHLGLRAFRSYLDLELDLAPGLNAIVGGNGRGKTNLLEAVAFAATVRSLRGAPPEALVTNGEEQAVVRVDSIVGDRGVRIECSITSAGRHRVVLNRQTSVRRRDLLDVLSTVVFSPDDLILVKGAPAGRRESVDDLAAAIRPSVMDDQRGLERVLRQRNALLKQSGGRLDPSSSTSLEVWDDRLSMLGTRVAEARRSCVVALEPYLASAYRRLAGTDASVEVRYNPLWWDDGLAAALVASRRDDLRRGVTTVGPHRDDVEIRLEAMAARTHASQGEQRCLALAWRLASHRLITEATGHEPVLLLDDVFSELDPQRSTALFDALPVAQTLLATAAAMPVEARPDQVVAIEHLGAPSGR